jgi:hypothetical protein
MLDSGHASDEFVRAGGVYPSKCYVAAGLATVRVLTPFSESVWAKGHEFVNGVLVSKTETNHE